MNMLKYSLLGDPQDRYRELALIRQLPLDLERGPWVAGGSVLKMMNGLEIGGSDIDIFVSSREQIDVISKILNKNSSNLGLSGRNLSSGGQHTPTRTFGVGYRKYQVIQFKAYPSLEDLFKSFDFTICQAATDGKTVVFPQIAKTHYENKRLVLTNPNGKTKISSAIRLSKYISAPFYMQPDPGLLKWAMGCGDYEFKGQSVTSNWLKPMGDDDYA